ncbi:hypothetical protein [Litoribacter populi]|uniref:hypothetical protein n=1 Tax=Litoribacter populi TaxID=2598460 RepID=UPI00117CF73A|nr:hypothetical protein [Litoribacter populi]
MAKQSSFLNFTGNIGKLTFYKNKDGYQVREKGGVSKERIMTDPKYARTRENMAEFAEAAKTVKLLKDSIRPALISAADSKLFARLQRAMVRVVKSDDVNSRGQRKVVEGNWNLLRGIQLNKSASLRSTLRANINLDNGSDAFSVTIPAFNPADLLVSPAGSTDFRMFLVGGAIAVGTDLHTSVRVDTGLLPQYGTTDPITLSIEKADLPYMHRLFVLGIEFVQMVNGDEATLHSSSYNAAAIVETEKV